MASRYTNKNEIDIDNDGEENRQIEIFSQEWQLITLLLDSYTVFNPCPARLFVSIFHSFESRNSNNKKYSYLWKMNISQIDLLN